MTGSIRFSAIFTRFQRIAHALRIQIVFALLDAPLAVDHRVAHDDVVAEAYREVERHIGDVALARFQRNVQTL